MNKTKTTTVNQANNGDVAAGYVHELHQLTRSLLHTLHELKPNMDHNEADDVAAVERVVQHRQDVIRKLDPIVREQSLHWEDSEQQALQEIAEWEKQIQPLFERLFQSFSAQIGRLRRGRQMANYYHGGNTPAYTDGAFIDRKG